MEKRTGVGDSLQRFKDSATNRLTKVRSWMRTVLFQWGLFIYLVGFLLGRAMILSEMLPFVVPFFAVIWMTKREHAKLAFIALILGTMSVNLSVAWFTVSALLVYALIQRTSELVLKKNTKAVFIHVFLSVWAVRFGYLTATEGMVSEYTWMISTAEASLSAVVTMIFFQSIPLLMERKRQRSYRNEEIICLMIFLASIMIGTIGWVVYGMAVESILARYVLLLAAFVGGAAIGSTVGVVTGLILSLANVASLYQMSLLAFSGLLGGLLREGKKMGVGVGLLIGTVLISMYGDSQTLVMTSIYETLVAISLFLLTPKSFIEHLSRYVPGTVEHSQEQQQYMRKVRDITAQKVEQFSDLFHTLSESFTAMEKPKKTDFDTKDMDVFLSRVTEHTCQTCFKKEKCWANKFEETYQYMEDLMQECQDEGGVRQGRLYHDFSNHCVKPDKVIQAIKDELKSYEASQQLQNQLTESRRLVADQLRGVSQVMDDFAKEIQREKTTHQKQEEQIGEAIADAGVDIDQVEIYQLDAGNIDIEITLPKNDLNESEKIVAPLLSSILEETIVVKHTEPSASPYGHDRVSFGSAKQFVVKTGVANAAKGGGWVSGDSYSTLPINAGKYALAISDGMGNGERAHIESSETLQLLRNVLQSGIEETVAIKSINSVLSLRSEDEIFSTLDLTMIDLQDASAKFLKVGSTPSFIKRGKQVKMVESSNLPIGMLHEFDVDVVNEQLKAGDLLILMSDGVYEGPKHIENDEVWMKRIIQELKTEDPQEVADVIMERVIRERGGHIVDDMTVMVAKVDHNLPKWASIPTPQYAIAK
ncbi:stage II sporulation protein E [Texcoconibacillus texcoconensis]